MFSRISLNCQIKLGKISRVQKIWLTAREINGSTETLHYADTVT